MNCSGPRGRSRDDLLPFSSHTDLPNRCSIMRSDKLSAASIDHSCPGLACGIRSLHSAWWTVTSATPRRPQLSDFPDALHAMYAPYVDVFLGRFLHGPLHRSVLFAVRNRRRGKAGGPKAEARIIAGRAVMTSPSLERDLHRHGIWPARRFGPSSASRAKRHAGVRPSAQTSGEHADPADHPSLRSPHGPRPDQIHLRPPGPDLRPAVVQAVRPSRLPAPAARLGLRHAAGPGAHPVRGRRHGRRDPAPGCSLPGLDLHRGGAVAGHAERLP